MNYDQLEEQYYILTQRNSELDKEINSLSLSNTALESSMIKASDEIKKTKAKNESLAEQLTEQSLKVVNLQVQLDSAKIKIVELESNPKDEFLQSNIEALRSAVRKDSEILQRYRNLSDLPQVDAQEYSIQAPMPMIAMPYDRKQIVLSVSDVFTSMQGISNDPYHRKEWHAMAKLGDKVCRYSTNTSMLDLERREDFAVVLNQMTEGLREVIIEQYANSHHF